MNKEFPVMHESPTTWVPMSLGEGRYAAATTDPAIQEIAGAARAARDAGAAILAAYQARQRDEMSSPAQRQAAAQAYAGRKLATVRPLVAAALQKAETAATQIEATISESLYSTASKWPFAAEARSMIRALHGPERTAAVRKLMVTDHNAAAAVLGAPPSVTGMDADAHAATRASYIARAYPGEIARVEAIRAAADHLATGARLLERKIVGLFDKNMIDHAALTRAAAEAAERH